MQDGHYGDETLSGATDREDESSSVSFQMSQYSQFGVSDGGDEMFTPMRDYPESGALNALRSPSPPHSSAFAASAFRTADGQVPLHMMGPSASMVAYPVLYNGSQSSSQHSPNAYSRSSPQYSLHGARSLSATNLYSNGVNSGSSNGSQSARPPPVTAATVVRAVPLSPSMHQRHGSRGQVPVLATPFIATATPASAITVPATGRLELPPLLQPLMDPLSLRNDDMKRIWDVAGCNGVQIPQVDGIAVHIGTLLSAVNELGGISQVRTHKKWQAVVEMVGLPALDRPFLSKLKRFYTKYVAPYERTGLLRNYFCNGNSLSSPSSAAQSPRITGKARQSAKSNSGSKKDNPSAVATSAFTTAALASRPRTSSARSMMPSSPALASSFMSPAPICATVISSSSLAPHPLSRSFSGSAIPNYEHMSALHGSAVPALPLSSPPSPSVRHMLAGQLPVNGLSRAAPLLAAVVGGPRGVDAVGDDDDWNDDDDDDDDFSDQSDERDSSITTTRSIAPSLPFIRAALASPVSKRKTTSEGTAPRMLLDKKRSKSFDERGMPFINPVNRLYLIERDEKETSLERMYSVLDSDCELYHVTIGRMHKCDCPDFVSRPAASPPPPSPKHSASAPPPSFSPFGYANTVHQDLSSSSSNSANNCNSNGNNSHSSSADGPSPLCKHMLFILTRVLRVDKGSRYLHTSTLHTSELMELYSAAPPNPSSSVNGVMSGILAEVARRERRREKEQRAPVRISSHTSSTASTNGDQDQDEFAPGLLDFGQSSGLDLKMDDEYDIESMFGYGSGACSFAGECTICYEPFGNERLTYCMAKCGNNFHRSCFQQWTTQHEEPVCPLCRAPWKDVDMEKYNSRLELGIPPDQMPPELTPDSFFRVNLRDLTGSVNDFCFSPVETQSPLSFPSTSSASASVSPESSLSLMITSHHQTHQAQQAAMAANNVAAHVLANNQFQASHSSVWPSPNSHDVSSSVRSGNSSGFDGSHFLSYSYPDPSHVMYDCSLSPSSKTTNSSNSSVKSSPPYTSSAVLSLSDPRASLGVPLERYISPAYSQPSNNSTAVAATVIHSVPAKQWS